jgi:hypothetical protein
MVYVHSNVNLIYKMREEWLKGKTKMWDVFPDDMDMENNIELALAKLDPNDPMLELVNVDDGNPLEGSSSIIADVDLQLDIKDENGGEGSGSGSGLDDFGYDMEEDDR